MLGHGGSVSSPGEAMLMGFCVSALIGVATGLYLRSQDQTHREQHEAQLKAVQAKAAEELSHVQDAGAARVGDLLRRLTTMEAINFEHIYELDSNGGQSCKWQMPALRCAAVRLGTTVTVKFRCTEDGCEFDRCAEVAN